MPLWVLAVSSLVIALVSATVGGAAGGFLRLEETDGEEQSPTLNSQLPSGEPERDPDTIAGVAQRVSPSVVALQPSSASDGEGGNGSGFVIHDNHVVTNDHVASALKDRNMEAVYSNGDSSGVKVVGTAPSSDLAVLKLTDPVDVQPLEFGNSDDAAVGDQVVAIGAPLGLAGTVTTGIISAVDRPVTVGERDNRTHITALQTDAAINPGNSGGPLIDAQGRVIGVNSAIATMGGGMQNKQGGSIGLGFAIPSAEAEDVVNQLLEDGEVTRAVIGVMLDPRHQEEGALIASDDTAEGDAVKPGGPADEAGLEPGDVITRFQDEKIADSNQLITLVQSKDPGDEVTLTYERDGEEETATLTLGSSTE
ncbi:S1C family serine protease [Haloactinospora alba]|uniref:S1C family serine protease n=1 Tax=Haloactinospora alba TaxID=405555 RepID=UPI001FEC479D|nr:trypsin-like peptidase domain-containing protein [Haloactinospora alba]